MGKLNEIYGSAKGGAPMKKGYHLPRAAMENADLARIINSNEVQSVLKPKVEAPATFPKHSNPLKNKTRMAELNPGKRTAAESESDVKTRKKAFEAKAAEAAAAKEKEGEDEEE